MIGSATLKRLYRAVFARPRLYPVNRFLLHCALHGMGIENHDSMVVSGELHCLRHLFGRPDPVILDVGANEGNYTRALLDLHPRARIHAFEPHPRTFARLSERFAGHPSVVLNNLALADAPSEQPLFDYGEATGSEHATFFDEQIRRNSGETPSSTLVTTSTVDDYLSQQGLGAVDLLKIDTEGYEYKVLKGASSALRQGKIRALHIEFNEMNIFARVFFRDFAEILSGYALYRMLPGGLLPLADRPPLETEIFAYQNLLAVHESFPPAQLRRLA